jgi:predicted ATPase
MHPGLGIADEALAAIARGGERHFLAPALLTRGDALLLDDAAQSAAAEGCYRQALEVARSQSAKAWELSAALRLARLWHAQGRTGAARDLLAPVHGWFAEGHATRDLRAAQALLDALRADRPLAGEGGAT